jgi:hypothetical protein
VSTAARSTRSLVFVHGRGQQGRKPDAFGGSCDGYGSAGVNESRPSSRAWVTASDRVEAWSLR